MMKTYKLSRGKFGVMAGSAAALSIALGMNAMAMTKWIDLKVNHDNIQEHNAGEAFMPEFELETENDSISVEFGNTPETTVNPTMPYRYELKIHSDNESLDDDLQIRGSGFRSSSVDFVSADNSDAQARLLVYPFYQLTAPAPAIDKAAKEARWAKIPYAGKYEYVISYTTKNGDVRTSHGTTKQEHVSVSSALSADADGEIGFAVRALATSEEGYGDARIENGHAKWDHLAESMGWADRYRIRIEYTNASGKNVKQEYNVSGTSYNVQSFINSAPDHKVRVTVRAVPKNNEHAYYNIALSEFGVTGGEAVELGDYEVDDPWAFLADYAGSVDGNFAAGVAAASRGGTGIGSSAGGSASGSGNGGMTGLGGSWKRVTYKWQYLENGAPFAGGWKQIGGFWYYFDADGYMHTGWLTDTDGKRYYLESKVGTGQGCMYTGAHNINGVDYTFGADGAVQ